MPDTTGNIAVPEIAVSGVFPIVPESPDGRASSPEVAIHQFGSGSAKIEQRFLPGAGARRFTVRRAWMTDAQRLAVDFEGIQQGMGLSGNKRAPPRAAAGAAGGDNFAPGRSG